MTVVLIIGVLIGLNALYVAAEFAAVSVSTGRIQHQADAGNSLARRLLPYLRDAFALDRYIAACQIGITLTSLILGAYGQATLSRALTPVFASFGNLQAASAEVAAVIAVLVGLTTLQMVLGELVPKSVALQAPTRTALLTVVPMQWSLWLFSWFIRILNGSGALLLRLSGFEQSGHRHIHSAEELDLLIAESRDGGLLDAMEQRRLRRALQLGTTRAADIMVPRVQVQALDIEAPTSEALSIITASPFTRLPVYRGDIDDVIGTIHTKEVARQVGNGSAWSLADMVRPALIVPQTITADALLTRMRDERARIAIVLDEYGGTAGLISVEDVLEQVIGEFADEFKPDEPHPEPLPDGRIRLPGAQHVNELERWLDADWTNGSTHTVGGRVVQEFGRVPTEGERIVIDDVEVEVERVRSNAVRSILARAVPAGSRRLVQGKAEQ